MTRTNLNLFGVFALTALLASISVAQVAKPGTVTNDIDTAGPGVTADYYGSGNDDAFAEYGATTFNFTPSDFGGMVTSVNSVDLTLTVNDRTFSDGDMVELWFTTDAISAQTYDVAFAPSGIDPAQYTFAPVSLGVFPITEMAGRPGGEIDVFSLPAGSIGTALVGSINSGTDFQILISATNDTHDITYSGVGNTFDEGDPTLSIDAVVVPEPASAVMLLLGFVGLLVRRRR